MELNVRVRSSGAEKYDAFVPVKPVKVTVIFVAGSVPVFLMMKESHAPRGPVLLHMLASTHKVCWELIVMVSGPAPSVKVVDVDKPEVTPTAVSKKLAPRESSGLTNHSLEKRPYASAVIYHGS